MARHPKKYFASAHWHNKCILKITAGLCLLILTVSSMAGCGTKRSAAVPSPEPTSIQAPPMRFVSGGINGSWVRIAAAIASKVNGCFEEYPVTVSTGGTVSNPYLIQKGEAEIGFTQGVFLSKALSGESPYENPLDHVTSIASLDTTAFYIIADEKLPEDTLGELIRNHASLRLGTLPQIDASAMMMEIVFQACGLPHPEVIQEPGTDIYIAEGSALFKAYQDHYFDVLIINETVPEPAIRNLMENRGSKIIALDPEVLAKLGEDQAWVPVTIPAGTYAGQSKEVQTLGLRTLLIARDDVPEEAVYYIAKALCENKAFFETVQDSYRSVNVNEIPEHLVIPLHPGAERYYREAGLLQYREAL